MDNPIFSNVTFADLTEEGDGLCNAVLKRTHEYILAGLIPFESYEKLVEHICTDLRSWCMHYVWINLDEYVGFMAKAFLRFVMVRYDFKEIKSVDDEDNLMSHFTHAEYDAFSRCLRADVSRELCRQDSQIVGMKEFLEKEQNESSNVEKENN
jgi:hypothetical protein